jgi:hypothetical protein
MRRLITGILSLAAGVAAFGSLQVTAADCAAPAPVCNSCQPRINIRPAICCRRAPCNALRTPMIKPRCVYTVPVNCCPTNCQPATTCNTVMRACPEPKVTCCSPKAASCAAPAPAAAGPAGEPVTVPAPPEEAAPAAPNALDVPAPPKEAA